MLALVQLAVITVALHIVLTVPLKTSLRGRQRCHRTQLAHAGKHIILIIVVTVQAGVKLTPVLASYCQFPRGHCKSVWYVCSLCNWCTCRAG